MSNINEAIEMIRQAIFDYLPPEDSKNNEIREVINNLLNIVEYGYVLVKWPESQNFMEEDWFEEEAILALGSENITGSSAYFIPIKRVV